MTVAGLGWLQKSADSAAILRMGKMVKNGQRANNNAA
jgi:hypothetical protein